jgi:hypothetical protein
MKGWNLSFLGASVLPGVVLLMRPLGINHDSALYLDCGRYLLRGMRPYVDFADLNPPLIMYLSAAPAWAAELLPIHIVTAFNLCIWMAVVGSAWIAGRLLLDADLGFEPRDAGILRWVVVLFSAGLLFTTDSDWGQREHLFILFYTPYFLCRWIRWEGGRVSGLPPIPLGIAAAVGAALKPHFVLIALVVEGLCVARKRRRGPLLQPELPAFVVTGAAYAAHFFLLPREVRETWFEYLVPMIRAGYGAYDRTPAEIVGRWGLVAAVVAASVGLIATGRSEAPRASLGRLMAAFSLAAIVVYLQQRKGWPYHLIPVIMIDAYDEPQGCPVGFTLPAYFDAAGFLAGEMADYDYWTDVFGWQVYRLVDSPAQGTGNGSERQP